VAEFLLEVCPSQATIEATASAALALRQSLQEEPLDSGSSGLRWREGACREAVGLVQRELDGDLRHAVDEWGGLRGAAGSGIDALFEAFVGVLRAASLEVCLLIVCVSADGCVMHACRRVRSSHRLSVAPSVEERTTI